MQHNSATSMRTIRRRNLVGLFSVLILLQGYSSLVVAGEVKPAGKIAAINGEIDRRDFRSPDPIKSYEYYVNEIGDEGERNKDFELRKQWNKFLYQLEDIQTKDHKNFEDFVAEIRAEVDDANDLIKELRKELDEVKRQLAELKNEPSDPNAPKDVSARLAAIEARLQALEARQPGGGGAAPLKLKLPFLLHDDQGNLVFAIDNAGISYKPTGHHSSFLLGDGELLLASGNNFARLSADPSEASMLVHNSVANSEIALKAEAESRVTVSNRTQTAELGTGDEFAGFRLSSQGQRAAEIGTAPGKGVALRMFNSSGNVVAGAGSNPNAGGAGLVFVGSGKTTNAAIIAAQADGSGQVQTFNSAGKVTTGMIGQEQVIAVYGTSGQPIATMSKGENSEGGNITARNPNGEGVFTAGFRGDVGGGEACVYRASSKGLYCLGLGLPGMGIGK